jgi:hypothetical protein
MLDIPFFKLRRGFASLQFRSAICGMSLQIRFTGLFCEKSAFLPQFRRFQYGT